jgi:hypothetical protein
MRLGPPGNMAEPKLPVIVELNHLALAGSNGSVMLFGSSGNSTSRVSRGVAAGRFAVSLVSIAAGHRPHTNNTNQKLASLRTWETAMKALFPTLCSLASVVVNVRRRIHMALVGGHVAGNAGDASG